MTLHLGAAGNPYDVNPPRNTAVVNGSTTTLECNIAGYDGNVVWRDYHTSSDQDIIAINRNVFGSHRFSGAFKIEGTYNLQVTASSDMSGKYGCETQDGTVQRYAYLIVTGKYCGWVVCHCVLLYTCARKHSITVSSQGV